MGMKLRPGDQPLPVVNSEQDIQSLVIADIEARRKVGIDRYGTALQPGNGRDSLRDAYEEALDLACYLRQAIEERDRLGMSGFPVIAGSVTTAPILFVALVDEEGSESASIAIRPPPMPDTRIRLMNP